MGLPEEDATRKTEALTSLKDLETQTTELRTALKNPQTKAKTILSKLELESLLSYSKHLFDFGEHAKSEEVLNSIVSHADSQLSSMPLKIQLGLLNT